MKWRDLKAAIDQALTNPQLAGDETDVSVVDLDLSPNGDNTISVAQIGEGADAFIQIDNFDQGV